MGESSFRMASSNLNDSPAKGKETVVIHFWL